MTRRGPLPPRDALNGRAVVDESLRQLGIGWTGAEELAAHRGMGQIDLRGLNLTELSEAVTATLQKEWRAGRYYANVREAVEALDLATDLVRFFP